MFLYGTLGCHLCEDAKAIVKPVFEASNIAWQEVDIANDDTLMQRYGTRIPVVLNPATGLELGWPFTGPEFMEWLQCQDA